MTGRDYIWTDRDESFAEVVNDAAEFAHDSGLCREDCKFCEAEEEEEDE